MLKSYCSLCEKQCDSTVLCENSEHWEEEEHGVDGTNLHRIVKCITCGTVSYRVERTCSEETIIGVDKSGNRYLDALVKVETYPKQPAWKRKEWLDRLPEHTRPLRKILEEVYAAYDVNLFALCAVGIRTVIERLATLLKVEDKLSFQEKLHKLRCQGYITERMKDGLAVLVEGGNAAAHRGWQPRREKLETLLQYLDDFLAVVLIDENLDPKSLGIPPKPPKR